MNLDAIRARAERCENARDSGDILGWGAVATESAADVPKLIAEVERLRDRCAHLEQQVEHSRAALAARVKDLTEKLERMGRSDG